MGTMHDILASAIVDGFNAGATEANAERDRYRALLRKLVDAWGDNAGCEAAPTIGVVGDRIVDVRCDAIDRLMAEARAALEAA